MKFGKQIQKRQLEVPEYAASFVNYKALKKVIYRATCPHPRRDAIVISASLTTAGM
jgi:SPX domain protein involved in polyphosphate accumulation